MFFNCLTLYTYVLDFLFILNLHNKVLILYTLKNVHTKRYGFRREGKGGSMREVKGKEKKGLLMKGGRENYYTNVWRDGGKGSGKNSG